MTYGKSSLLLSGLLLMGLFLLGGCSEEEKKPEISANLCLTLPNEMVLGPYDTKEACQTARENMPDGVCATCEKK
jgi:hypothetical protein